MSIEFSSNNGKIEVANEAIATIVGASVSEVYGVIGMSSQKKVKDSMVNMLKKDNYTKGIIVDTQENDVSIQVYIVVQYGVKISEVARNIQEKVKFTIEKMLDMKVSNVSVYVEDVKVAKIEKTDKGAE